MQQKGLLVLIILSCATGTYSDNANTAVAVAKELMGLHQ